jgi:phosphatidylinositol-3-phosphatase
MSGRRARRSWVPALPGLCALVLVGALLLHAAPRSPAIRPLPPAGGALPGRFPRLGRVAVLVLENREYGAVLGRPGQYVTRLARRYALATRYYALGHPSLPNYLALTAGSTFGVHRDCNGCSFAGPNLVQQLDSAGIGWKAYFQSLPRAGYLGARDYPYTKHLNPFVYFDDLTDQRSDRARIVSFRALGGDLRSHRLARFVWLAPNLCNDSHYCSVARSDRYVAHLVPPVLRALGPGGVLFVTWDEGTTEAGAHRGRGGGHIALIAAGPAARRGVVVRTVATHYSLLRTIEAGFGLPALGRAGSPATPLLAGLLRQTPPAGRIRYPAPRTVSIDATPKGRSTFSRR